MLRVLTTLLAVLALAGCGGSESTGTTSGPSAEGTPEETAERLREAHATGDCAQASQEATTYVALLERDDVPVAERQAGLEALLTDIGEDCEDATFTIREALP
jgi:hypothetical protein